MKSLSFVPENASSLPVWQHFLAISEIPRPSGHEQQLKEHIIGFAESKGLEWKEDQTGNIVVRKPATAGREGCPVVTMQGHLDMVPQKGDDSDHDFLTDPITLVPLGDWLKADNTTLGADNGIGVAAALAVLDSDTIEHGPVEALFTIEEETTLAGAEGIDPAMIQGDILLNLDTEENDKLYVGCAGGMNVEVDHQYRTEPVPAGYQAVKLALSGLKGGHSGCDVHLQRGNSIKLMARVLKSLQKFDIRLNLFNGGSVDNAIPRSAGALIVLPEAQYEAFTAAFDAIVAELTLELNAVEPDFRFKLEEAEMPVTVMALAEQQLWLKALHACHNGVFRFSDHFDGVVETSNNLGVLRIENGQLLINCFARSLVDSAVKDLVENVAGVFEMTGAEVKRSGFFPGWKPEPKSAILDLMAEQYEKLNGDKPGVEVIHAALECGLLGAARPGMDMISFGPTIEFPHSPDEKIYIPSVESFWKLLVATLQALK
ncbi:aminoacyl-histidine dipeptidase [Endozoicomonadaceae bacterium StTr2]